MSIKPTHGTHIGKAQRIFADRQPQQALFIASVRKEQRPDGYRVIAWVGVGGQGKSALLQHLRQSLKTSQELTAAFEQLGLAALDMDRPKHRDIDGALLDLRIQLRESLKSPFPAFDTAFSRLILLENPKLDIRLEYPALFKGDNAILNDIASFSNDILSEIPGVNLLYKYGKQLTATSKSWWERRGKQVLEGLDGLRADQIRDRLPVYLGADIADILDQKKGTRVVVFIDSHEALWRGRPQTFGIGRIRSDEWLRRLVSECPGVLFNIFSREHLEWEIADPEWGDIVDTQILGPIPDEDCHQFVMEAGVADKDIQQRIVDSADGLPFYLHLQLDLYEDLSAAKETPSANNFGGSHPEILARFVDHLSHIEMEALAALSYPRFIPNDLTGMFRESLWNIVPSGIDAAKSRSFMTSYGDESENPYWLMHALMRDQMQDQEQQRYVERFRRSHEDLHNWYAQRAEVEDPRDVTPYHVADFVEATFHLDAFDSNECSHWVLEQYVVFAEAGRWKSLEEPLTRARESALRHGQEKNAVYLTERLATCLKLQGRFDEARILYEEALQNTEGEPEIVPEIDVAQWKNNFGNLHYLTENYDEAKRLYKDAIEIGERASAEYMPRLAEWLDNLAHLHHALSEFSDAKVICERAVNMTTQSQGAENSHLAVRLHGLGRVYQDLGDYPQAEEILKRSLKMTIDTLGSTHMNVAGRLDNLGRLCRDAGKLEDALRYCEDAVQIGEEALGPDHPELAMWFDNLALVHRDLGDLDKAESLSRRAAEITRAALGDEHTHLATWLSNLSLTLKDKGRFDEAAEIIEGVLTVYRATYGEDHAWVAVTLGNKANLLMDAQLFEQAAEHYDAALAIFERIGLHDHANYARTLHLKGKVEAVLGKTDLAAQKIEAAMTIYKKQLDPTNPWLEDAYSDLQSLMKEIT